MLNGSCAKRQKLNLHLSKSADADAEADALRPTKKFIFLILDLFPEPVASSPLVTKFHNGKVSCGVGAMTLSPNPFFRRTIFNDGCLRYFKVVKNCAQDVANVQIN